MHQANPSRPLADLINTLNFPSQPISKTRNFLENSCSQTNEGSLVEFFKSYVYDDATSALKVAGAVIEDYRKDISEGEKGLKTCLKSILPTLYYKVKKLYPNQFSKGKFPRKS